jgi:hypothetical protein
MDRPDSFPTPRLDRAMVDKTTPSFAYTSTMCRGFRPSDPPPFYRIKLKNQDPPRARGLFLIGVRIGRV